jgi:predicted DNA-binding transcriptional regulator AlpA
VTKVNPRISDNLAFDKAGSEGCSVCRDLLVNLSRFFDMLDAARQHNMSDLLTVDEVAKELKVSKSIVYRLIRKGEIKAVDIVDSDGEVPKKGHYRIKRQNLNRYLESKTVKPFSSKFSTSRSRYFPKVKNHLGL